QFTRLVDIRSISNNTLRDVVALAPAADSAWSGKRTFVTANGIDDHTPSTATNITSFKGLGLGYQAFTSEWTVTNLKEADSPAPGRRAAALLRPTRRRSPRRRRVRRHPQSRLSADGADVRIEPVSPIGSRTPSRNAIPRSVFGAGRGQPKP